MDEHEKLLYKSPEELIDIISKQQDIIFRQEDTIKHLSGEVMGYEAQASHTKHQLNKVAASITIKGLDDQ